MTWLWAGMAIMAAGWTWWAYRAKGDDPRWFRAVTTVAAAMLVTTLWFLVFLEGWSTRWYLPWPALGFMLIGWMAIAALLPLAAERLPQVPWLPLVGAGLVALAALIGEFIIGALAVTNTAVLLLVWLPRYAFTPGPRPALLAATLLVVPAIMAFPVFTFMTLSGGMVAPADYTWEVTFTPNTTDAYVLLVPLPTYQGNDSGSAHELLWDAVAADGEWRLQGDAVLIQASGPVTIRSTIRFTGPVTETFPAHPTTAALVEGTTGTLQWSIDMRGSGGHTCGTQWTTDHHLDEGVPTEVGAKEQHDVVWCH